MSREIELAWAAGFFEGEGTVTKNGIKHFKIAIAQSGNVEDGTPYTLIRFKEAVSISNPITGPYHINKTNRKPNWYFQICGSDAHQVMALLDPYFSEGCVKRQKYLRYCERGWD